MLLSVDIAIMHEALDEARLAFDAEEIPVGAVLVCDGEILARAHNTREHDKNPLLHAELKVLQAAAQIRGDWRLSDCELYVTLEPCPMCLGALFQARVGRLVFGCSDEKRSRLVASTEHNVFPSLDEQLSKGSPIILTSNNHNIEIHGGILQEEASALLRLFFKQRRQR